jgi:nucleoside-diphosphate-sugar epimerase
MDILFTGSSGFIGKNIIDKFKIDHNVFTLSRHDSFYNIDLAQSIPILQHKFDLVIHAAGVAHMISNSSIDNQFIYDSNINATRNLLQSLNDTHIPSSFIFLSSVAVYGLEEGYLINESNDLRGQTSYARSKIECENIIINWCNVNNVTCTILRLPLLVGPNAKGNLGALVKSIRMNMYFNVSGNNAKKSMLHVYDVYNFIQLSYSKGGIFNLTDGIDPSIVDFTNRLALTLGKRKTLNIPYNFIKFVSKIGDIFGNNFFVNSFKLKKLTSSLTFSNFKATSTFNWKPISVIDNLEII